MSKLGIITNRQITTNRDGNATRIILQVNMMEDDVRTVEMVGQAGEDTNPANGCRVVVIDITPSHKLAIAVTDDLAPECDPGEKEIYSTDNPVSAKKARTLWNSDGDIIHDADGGAKLEILNSGDVVHNSGTESAVSYTALNNALQLLVTAINAAFATKADAAGANPGITLDISLAESGTVKIP